MKRIRRVTPVTPVAEPFNSRPPRRSNSSSTDIPGAKGGTTMRKTSWAVLVMAAFLAVPAANAGTVNERERNQRERIRQGVSSGELTHREAARLRGEQAGVRAEERRFRSTGGGLNRWERRDLQHDQNRTSRDIHNQKHDGQTR